MCYKIIVNIFFNYFSFDCFYFLPFLIINVFYFRNAYSILGKRFINKGHLNNHRSVHSDEKPYDCEVCGKIYKRKKELNRHIQRSHLRSLMI